MRICLYFRIDGLAEDEHGAPAPAGLEICVGEMKDADTPYDELVKQVNIAKLFCAIGLGGIEVDRVTPITREEYDAAFGDDED